MNTIWLRPPALALCGALAVFWTGCAATTEIPPGTRCVISSSGQVALFKIGPAQTNGPDVLLNDGTPVIMTEKGWGYCRVMTEEGLSGYVESGALIPAPPEPRQNLPATTSRPLSLASWFAPKRPAPANIPAPPLPNQSPTVEAGTGGLFDVGDVPMALGESMEPVKPDFRANVKPRTRPFFRTGNTPRR